ncbi:MAG: phosphoribosylamine--glycine ligase [Candidatus Omnitrophota bacterium]
MKVLLIGSGGREHALAWKLAQSPLLPKLYAAPGNAGISQLAECVPVAADNIPGLLEFALREKIDLTIVGPEVPLVAGIGDVFRENGLLLFGPSKDTALLEGSKAFSKEIMTKYGVPTASYEIFRNVNEAKHYVIEAEMPLVIKADGLAAGKGVVICDSSEQAVATLTQMMEEKLFGDAGSRVIIEKKLEGEELSILVLTDGKKIIPLASARDHKRAYDHDRGPNTGGMGAFSPSMKIPESEIGTIIDIAVRPILEGLARDGMSYRGVLYAGIMLTKDGPFVLEYNCRFGDPETEVILPRLKSDLLPVMVQIANGCLDTERLEWHDKACMTVVMASGGYPGHYEKGFPIQGLETVKGQPDVAVFHAGTAFNAAKQVVTAGGRVLAVTAWGDTLKAAHERVYHVIKKINFEGGFCRRDIGQKAIAPHII